MRRLTFIALVAITAASASACSIIESHPTPASPTGTLQGVVTSSNGPVANATVSVTASDATQHVGLSNADGFYSIASIPTGPATYAVRATGFAEVDGSITIMADPMGSHQDISLNPQ